MKKLNIIITDSEHGVLFKTSTTEIAETINELDPCTVEDLTAQDLIDFLKDELSGDFYKANTKN